MGVAWGRVNNQGAKTYVEMNLTGFRHRRVFWTLWERERVG